MARVTHRQLRGSAEAANRMLARRSSSARLHVEQRNGYTAVDLYDADGRCLKTLLCGSTGELQPFVMGVMEGLWLLDAPFAQNAVGGAA